MANIIEGLVQGRIKSIYLTGSRLCIVFHNGGSITTSLVNTIHDYMIELMKVDLIGKELRNITTDENGIIIDTTDGKRYSYHDDMIIRPNDNSTNSYILLVLVVISFIALYSQF